uniref:Major facilitator superfamily (MFS) profile domain-containing protein n=1 Tax=Bionectria ochroleuca TaxID=29856 RepID=A0A0B7JQ38_BIOOC
MAIAMGWQKPDNVAGTSAPAIMVGLFVATGGILFGYDTGAINGILAMRAFKDQFGTNCYDSKNQLDICPEDSSIIVAILSAGTAVAVGIFCAGAICQVCAQATPLMLVGRFLAGVGVGMISVLVPLYQSEMAPRWIRGTLVCAYQLSITIGLLSASIVNVITAEMKDSSAYRIPLGLQLFPALILTGGLMFLPETPRYLVMKGEYELAGISLSRLRRLDITHPVLVEELAEIKANHAYELSLGSNSYKDLLFGTPHLGRRTITGCTTQILQQLSGINFIMYYSTTFYDGAGVQSPYTKSLINNVINVVATIPGLLVIETWGRRKLLMIGAIGMATCQLFIATFSTAAGHDLQEAAQLILVVFCAINIFFFAASWGPVAWVVTSEIYPLKIRAKAISVSTASNWLFNFGIAYSTPFMVGTAPRYADFGPKIFFIWGAFCILSVFFVWSMVYETSKMSLEQIDEMYERIDHAWNSKNFEPNWSFQQIVHEGLTTGAQTTAPHELQSTTSQTSADTTLGDTESSGATQNSETNNGSSSSQDKAQPVMAHVDFTY